MIYPRLLGSSFETLPPVLRALHSTLGERRASGTVSVRHQRAWLAWLVGFPAAGDDIPIRLEVVATDEEEIWTRWFGATMRRSVQRVAGNLLMETAGPVCIGFQIRACETGIHFKSQRARLWGIPAPLRIEAVARGGDSSWQFQVTVAHVGSYRGVMTLDA